jgi:hypothetical protein
MRKEVPNTSAHLVRSAPNQPEGLPNRSIEIAAKFCSSVRISFRVFPPASHTKLIQPACRPVTPRYYSVRSDRITGLSILPSRPDRRD